MVFRMTSPTRQLAELALHEPLTDYITTRRKNGKSWRRISLDLRDDTNGQVDISSETLRAWFPELTEVQS